jgi:hypothetical protein
MVVWEGMNQSLITTYMKMLPTEIGSLHNRNAGKTSIRERQQFQRQVRIRKTCIRKQLQRQVSILRLSAPGPPKPPVLQK